MTKILFAGALAATLAGCGTQLVNRHSVTEATWRVIRAPRAATVVPASAPPATPSAPTAPPASNSPSSPPELVP